MAQRRLAITSRFELAVIAVIMAMFAFAMVAVEAGSERLSMTLAIRNMRSGLNWAMAERLMRGEEFRLGELVDANPLELLDRRQGAYQGVSDNWRFDAVRHELIYRPRISAAFEGRDELRWRIVGTPGPSGRVTELRLVEVPPPSLAR